MSRNEMFFLLACAFVAAIMSANPVSSSHQPPMSIASLLSPHPDVVAWNEPAAAEHDLSRP